MIPEDEVIGRAFLIVWPPSQWRILPIPATFQQPGITRAASAAAEHSAPQQSAATHSAAEPAAELLRGVPVRPVAPYLPSAAGCDGHVPDLVVVQADQSTSRPTPRARPPVTWLAGWLARGWGRSPGSGDRLTSMMNDEQGSPDRLAQESGSPDLNGSTDRGGQPGGYRGAYAAGTSAAAQPSADEPATGPIDAAPADGPVDGQAPAALALGSGAARPGVSCPS